MKVVSVGFTDKEGNLVVISGVKPDCAIIIVEKEPDMTVAETAVKAMGALKEIL